MSHRWNTASKSESPVDASTAYPCGWPPKSKVVKSKQFIDNETEYDVWVYKSISIIWSVYFG